MCRVRAKILVARKYGAQNLLANFSNSRATISLLQDQYNNLMLTVNIIKYNIII